MRIKDRIHRAFTGSRPNVLSRVLEDCPAPQKSVAPRPKKKRLSDRAMQFIATAASFAILISAVSGGFVYFRNYYDLQAPGDGGLNSKPPAPTNFTDPLPTQTMTGDELMLWIKDDARQIICPGATAETLPVEVRLDLPYPEQDRYASNCYVASASYEGYHYALYYTQEGVLSRIGVLSSSDAQGYISQTVAEQIARLDTAQTKPCRVTMSTLLVLADGSAYYRVNLTGEILYWSADCYINAMTGQIEEPQPIGAKAARDIVLNQAGVSINDVTQLYAAEEDYNYRVIYGYNGWWNSYLVDRYSGEILSQEDSLENGPEPGQGIDGLIGWRSARDIGLEYLGLTIDDITGFYCMYHPDDNAIYSVGLTFGQIEYGFQIDAKTGDINAVIHDPGDDIPSDTLDAENAAALALAHAGLSADNTMTLSWEYDDTVEGAYCYWFRFLSNDIYYVIAVHAQTGEILHFESGKEDPAALTTLEALHIAYSYTGLSFRDCIDFSSAYSADHPGYIGAHLSTDTSYHYLLISENTGEIVSHTIKERKPSIDQLWAELIGVPAARDIALAHSGLDSQSIVYLYYEFLEANCCYEIHLVPDSLGLNSKQYCYTVDASTGKILNYSGPISREDPTPDETRLLTEEQVLQSVLDNGELPSGLADYALADPDNRVYVSLINTGSLRYHVALMDEDTYCFWDVDVYSGDILSSGTVALGQPAVQPAEPEEALQVILDYYGHSRDKVSDISCELFTVEYEPYKSFYYISYVYDNRSSYGCNMINCYTLAFMNQDELFPENAISEDAALQAVKDYSGITENMQYLAILQCYDEYWQPYYVVDYVYNGLRYHYKLDCWTGEVYESTVKDDYAILGNIRRERDWYDNALSCLYESPAQLDLAAFFYNGFADESQLPTDEERALLEDVLELNLDLIRLPAQKMDAILLEYFDITLEEMDPSSFDGLYYLESTDCYYMTHGDAYSLDFIPVSIESISDKVFSLTYRLTGRDTLYIATFTFSDVGYQVISNLPA